MKIISLFANIGVAEAYLEKIGFKVVLANESLKRRADLYSKIYPKTKMICGDFVNKEIFQSLIKESKKEKIDIVMATPPCQGMSTAGQQKEDDKRNSLIIPTIDFILKVAPKYVFIENVPLFLNTKIYIKKQRVLIKDLIREKLGSKYHIEINVVDTKDYSIPQTRERAIILMTRKNVKKIWQMPVKHRKIVTMEDAIGHLPSLDPFIKDISEQEFLKFFPDFYKKKNEGLKFSKWNRPPHHLKRQVIAMMHTPSGKSAFNNMKFPPIKGNGDKVKGFLNTYKRQEWNRPAYTITMDNVKISSQNNVHPGRLLKKNSQDTNIYSDARALTVYELMLLMTLPNHWTIPENTSEAFLRRLIGEGVPPLLIKSIFQKLS